MRKKVVVLSNAWYESFYNMKFGIAYRYRHEANVERSIPVNLIQVQHGFKHISIVLVIDILHAHEHDIDHVQ